MVDKKSLTTLRACRSGLGGVLFLTVALAWQGDPSRSSAADAAETPAVLEITQDTALDLDKTYGRIVIKASNVTLDGQGAWVIGSTKGKPRTYKQTGISAEGVSGVTLKNVKVKGWETGLKVVNGSRWRIENCDFSDNFHDPEQGWWGPEFRGGIVLEHVTHSTLRMNRANRVWDACSLIHSDDNTLEENDFSHASNTCLRLWTACRNRVRKNNLSWGLRIKTGEVHARDSACLLVESGSNDNRFLDNDVRHGGDGVFVRALNGWVSSGNLFEDNDASYAHNNCFEGQSPRNTYRHNKANHGSHGFWLGISDQTVLEDNEACDNGDPKGHHNAPWPFSYAPIVPKHGHAGIIFAGPASHTIARRNKCLGNNGAGIALFGDSSPQHRYKDFHWVLEQNTIRGNRWGLYLEYVDWIDMAGNECVDNQESNLVTGGVATNLTIHPDNPAITRPPRAVLAGPSSGIAGREVVLDASESTDPGGNRLGFRWDLGDGTILTQPRAAHVFKGPGFYRIGVTTTNGRFSDLAWRDFRVVEDIPEWGTEGQAAEWGWEELYPREGLHVQRGKERAVEQARAVREPQSRVEIAEDLKEVLAGKSSVAVRVSPSGNPIRLMYPRSRKAGIPLAGKTHLVFWSKLLNGNIHAWKGLMPTVTLFESEEKFALLRPFDDPKNYPQNPEDRADWMYRTIPLAGDAQWKLEGKLPATLNYAAIEFFPWGSHPVRLWLDGMSLK
jgi:nitrous oxidase accessory protein NosD